MKKILHLLCALGFCHLAAGPALAWDVFQAYDKVIHNQPQQLGTGYEMERKSWSSKFLPATTNAPPILASILQK